MKTIRWGIIGVGRFGAIHASAIRDMAGSQLTAICHRNTDKLKAAHEQFPEAIAETDYQRLLESNDVDVISITTHWQHHFEIAVAALKAGKHVFLEKPMASSSAECRELVSLAEDSAGFLMVGHICRFDPRVSLARDAIVAGRIGRIVSMHAKRNLPKAPGNIRLDKISPLMGDGIHDADLMLWLMQSLPSRVYARTVRYSGHQYPDLGWAMLEFGDQAIGVIETVWCLPENVPTVIDARFEVIGTDGMLTIDCAETGFHLINPEGSKMADTVFWPSVHGRRTGALVNELSYFAECVRNGTKPTVITPAEAAAAVYVMECAEQSAMSGHPVNIAPADS